MKIEENRPYFKSEITNTMEAINYIQTEYNLSFDQAIEVMNLNHQEWISGGIICVQDSINNMTDEMFEFRQSFDKCIGEFQEKTFFKVSAAVQKI